MNKVVLIGRLTADPEVRYTSDTCVARYSLAVQKRGEGADFLNCVAFGKAAEFVSKYLTKGIKIAVVGRISTGSYINKDGAKVNTWEIIAEEHEFVEKRADATAEAPQKPQATNSGFTPLSGFDTPPFA